MSQQAAVTDETGRDAAKGITVTVDYLPATEPFHRQYSGTETVEQVRVDAMIFFGVRDRQERDRYEYFLEFERARISNTSQTLEALLGPHRRGAHFHLIEQITPGARE